MEASTIPLTLKWSWHPVIIVIIINHHLLKHFNKKVYEVTEKIEITEKKQKIENTEYTEKIVYWVVYRTNPYMICKIALAFPLWQLIKCDTMEWNVHNYSKTSYLPFVINHVPYNLEMSEIIIA